MPAQDSTQGQSPPSLRWETLTEPVTSLLSHHDLLRTLLQRQVVADAVQTVSLSTAEREPLLQAYCQRHKLSSDASLEQHLAQRCLSREALQWQLELPLRIQRYSEANFSAKAEQRFLERKTSLDQVVYSLLRLQNGYLARELYLQIAEGESDFATLAAQHAEGPERNTRGIIGPVPMTQAHPQLAERLRISAPGTLLEPFQIDQWWLVVRLERYLPASFDAAMRQRMCQEQFEHWVQDEVARTIAAPSAAMPSAAPGP